MLVFINEVKDKNGFEDKVAYLKALLINEYISKLNISKEMKNKVKKEVIKKLQNT